MSMLNKDWKPESGSLFTWLAMDKLGRLALMVNNCFGDIPRCVLILDDVQNILGEANDYAWGESVLHCDFPKDKCGDFKVDMYSFWAFKNKKNREEVEKGLLRNFKVCGQASEVNLAVNKGFFEYYAVEGSYEGEDYPVGYNGKTKMGDYYRFLVPSIYASISDFPKDLHHVIAVSPTLDFTRDRVLDNNKINEYFPSCYSD